MNVWLENGGDSRGFGPLSLLHPLQVVAVVMDMFTDVDLLSEVLEAAARRVPVRRQGYGENEEMETLWEGDFSLYTFL